MADRALDQKTPETFGRSESDEQELAIHNPDVPLAALPKSSLSRAWPTIACGAGLFADGYLNSVIGSVNVILGIIYGTEFTHSPARTNIAALTFVGTVLGTLIFGYTSDRFGRALSLQISTVILFIFAALSAGAYGAGGNIQGTFAALSAYRFLIGIGIGGEYPAGSVGAAESSGELKEGHRNRWFIASTNVAIDFGFIVGGALVPMILTLITGGGNLGLVWRLSLGLGCIPPLAMVFIRMKLKEPEEFNRHSFKNTHTPYWLTFKFYGFRLAVVSTIWFIYDLSSYSFGYYSGTWLYLIIGDNAPLWQTFGWYTLIDVFYFPGAIAGAWISDWIGPRKALAIFVFAQGVVGFIMAGAYNQLATYQNVAAFVVVYGIFLALGEVGPGDNIGLLAAKTSATGIRGKYYAIAASIGKLGAFAGIYVFADLQNDFGGPDSIAATRNPFWVASGLCIFSAILAWFFIPEIKQNTIELEDARYRAYLEEHGYDTSRMGAKEFWTSDESVATYGAPPQYEKQS